MADLTKKFIKAAAVLLQREDGKILVMQRKNASFADGMYTLPTGHVEDGEEFLDAAIRETAEEAGILLNAEDMTLFHTCESNYGNRYDLLTTHFFKATKWEGEAYNAEPHKCSDFIWIDPSELPEPFLINMKIAVFLSHCPDVTTMKYPMHDSKNLADFTRDYSPSSPSSPS